MRKSRCFVVVLALLAGCGQKSQPVAMETTSTTTSTSTTTTTVATTTSTTAPAPTTTATKPKPTTTTAAPTTTTAPKPSTTTTERPVNNCDDPTKPGQDIDLCPIPTTQPKDERLFCHVWYADTGGGRYHLKIYAAGSGWFGSKYCDSNSAIARRLKANGFDSMSAACCWMDEGWKDEGAVIAGREDEAKLPTSGKE